MAKKKDEEHTALGLTILRAINEPRAYARGEVNRAQATTFHVPQTNVRKIRKFQASQALPRTECLRSDL